MKLGQLVTALPVLQKLADANLTPKTLYRVHKLLSAIDKELAIYNEGRTRIIKELGTETEPGKWQVTNENRDLFADRMTELANVDIQEDLKTVCLPTTENITLSYNDLCALNGIIELEDTESE